jgi:hypothetical protein
VSIPAGQRQVLIGATGRDGPPLVTLTSPSGKQIQTSGKNTGTIGSSQYLIIREEKTKTTFFLIGRPEAGSWKVTLDPSSPTPLVQVGSANALPDPQVSARVRSTKGRYALVWKLRPLEGQVVRFREVTKRSVHDIVSTNKASGTVPFVPIDDGSRGKRKIEAFVEQNNLPRAQLALGTFAGPAPHALRRPGPISFTRRASSVLARWKPVARVARYELIVTVTDGRHELRSLPAKTRSILIKRVSARERVTVKLTAVAANGLRSPARVSILKAQKPPKPPKKPKKPKKGGTG